MVLASSRIREHTNTFGHIDCISTYSRARTHSSSYMNANSASQNDTKYPRVWVERQISSTLLGFCPIISFSSYFVWYRRLHNASPMLCVCVCVRGQLFCFLLQPSSSCVRSAVWSSRVLPSKSHHSDVICYITINLSKWADYTCTDTSSCTPECSRCLSQAYLCSTRINMWSTKKSINCNLYFDVSCVRVVSTVRVFLSLIYLFSCICFNGFYDTRSDGSGERKKKSTQETCRGKESLCKSRIALTMSANRFPFDAPSMEAAQTAEYFICARINEYSIGNGIQFEVFECGGMCFGWPCAALPECGCKMYASVSFRRHAVWIWNCVLESIDRRTLTQFISSIVVDRRAHCCHSCASHVWRTKSNGWNGDGDNAIELLCGQQRPAKSQFLFFFF